MASRRPKLFLSCLVLAGTASGLAVSPDSPCTPVCLDDSPILSPTSTNASSPSTPTFVCRDGDFTNNTVGEKFKECVSCLQTSEASSPDGDDQGMYLSNLRSTVSSCNFSSNNGKTENARSCSSASTCGPFQNALQASRLNSSTDSFFYCSADNNAFMGENLSSCIECLQTTEEEKFMANFMIALQAGCLQRPTSQKLIGLEGDLFSATPVKITFPVDPPTQAKDKKSLSREAIIGIAVGAGALLLSAIGVLFICSQRRQQKLLDERRKSTLDTRFGSTTITSPNNGAFSNPYSTPPVNVKGSFSPLTASSKYLEEGLNKSAPSSSDFKAFSFPTFPTFRRERPIKQDTRLDNLSPASEMPTHPAYIPELTSPVSPTTSMATNTTWEVSQPSSAKPSPRIFNTMTFEAHEITVLRTTPILQAPEAPRRANERTLESSRVYSPRLQSHSIDHSSRMYAQNSSQPHDYTSTSRISPPALYASSRSRSHSLSQSTLRPRSRSRSQSRRQLYNLSRSNSIAEDRRRSTALVGVGNANASQEKPIRIEGPTAMRGTRFDFEKAEMEEKEREEREGKRILVKMRKEAGTPVSADEGEMWPGRY